MTVASQIVRRPLTIDGSLPKELHPVAQRVLLARQVSDIEAISTSLAGMHPADGLGHINEAVALIEACLRAGSKILIIGDFDADGATSTALAIRALRAMGAAEVDYLVPNRFEFGYGLTPEIVAVAITREPALIITVDNGVSSIEGVAAARAAGVKVLVTDHHLPGDELPLADAIVNPNLVGDGFPSKHLAGVGVIFYVMTALRARLRATAWFEQQGLAEPRLAELLDLVALGTVADVVVLDHNNRRLVAQGLARIRAGRCQSGITALINAAGREPERLTTSDLGFAVGPRLNAAGRLADMSVGIECLLSDNPDSAAALADKLDRLNRERREIETEMRNHAFDLVEETLPDANLVAIPAALCVYHESWHQGVIGIVAARVKDRFHRPAIAFAPGDDDSLKGSARSIAGLHIRDALADIAARKPGLIGRFGGHAMAAGLTIDAGQLGEFSEQFAAAVEARLGREAKIRQIDSDGELAAADFSLELARELADLAPWGQGFPEPRFDGLFTIDERRVVGGDHGRLVLRSTLTAEPLTAIAFGAASEAWFLDAEQIRAVYKLDVNRFRGKETLQLVIDYAERV